MATEAPPNSSSYILDPEPGSSEYEAPAEEVPHRRWRLRGSWTGTEEEVGWLEEQRLGGIAGWGGHLSIPPY